MKPLALPLLLLMLPPLSGCEDRFSTTFVVRRPPYPRPRCAKGPVSLGRLHPTGAPIEGATVSIKPGSLSGTTDQSGRLVLAGIRRGRYRLDVRAAGYRILPPREIELPVEDRLVLRLYPCISAGRDQLRVGFEKRVTLAARNLCGPPWKDAKLRWRQLEGPDVGRSVHDWTGRTLTFTTASLLETRGSLPELPQVLSFSPDQAGEYVFELRAVGPSGQRSTSQVMVTATNTSSGTTSVPAGDRIYFVGDKGGPWKWRVINTPPGWRLEIGGLQSRTPSLRPIPPRPLDGHHTVMLQDQHTRRTFSLAVGNWNVVQRDCGRAECHASMENNWKETTHARSWQRLLDGKLALKRGRAAERCATCHSLGYDRSARNGGYDEAVDHHRIAFPHGLRPGNYQALPEEVKRVSNVYCLACHGPARVDPPVADQPGLLAVGVCARCHDRLPEQALTAQWRLSKHAATVTSELNGPARRPACARCHSAQAYYNHYEALGRPTSRRVGVLICCDQPQPLTCQACHNAMLARHPAQLYRHGEVTTDSGVRLEKIGGAAQCALCHNAGANPLVPETIARRLGPHAPQAELTFGRGGFVLRASADYPALAGLACAEKAKDGCIGCHMHEAKSQQLGRHTFRVSEKKDGRTLGENVALCRDCHPKMSRFNDKAKADYDGDGAIEGVQNEVDGLLALLRERLQAAVVARGWRGCRRQPGRDLALDDRLQIVVVDAAGKDIGDCDGNGVIEREERPFTLPDDALELHKAAYNYFLVVKDASRGLHNLPYALKLLQRTTYAASGGRDLPAWTIRK